MTSEDLKEWRVSVGWTQAELAKRIGISHSQLWRIESGKCKLSKPLQIVLTHLAAEIEQESAA